MSLAELLRQRALSQTPKSARAALLARLGLTAVRVEGQADPPDKFRRPVVRESDDLERILALPRRTTVEEVPLDRLKRVNDECRCAAMGRACARELLPIQRQALSEASRQGGLLGAIGVGHGKELICELLPLVVPGVKTAVLLIPPDMREAFRLDWEYYGQHWLQPNLVGGRWFRPGAPRLKVIAYSELSHEKFTAALRSLAPDLIVANEAHALCGMGSVRTQRVLSYAAENPACRFVFVSGTLTKRSLRDYGHLSALALGQGSPLPLEPRALDEWACAVDPVQPGGKLPALMGALKALCEVGEDVRSAFKRRRAQTPGVIDTADAAIPNALNIRRRDPPEIPWAVRDALAKVSNARPDGEEFTEAWQVAKCRREIASGFYYRWIYPRGEPEDLVRRWFSARQAWHREVRKLLQYPRPHLDSPLLAARAAIRAEQGRAGDDARPVWHSRCWAAWRDVRKLVKPETQAVWLDDWLARDAAEWALDAVGIVWYSNVAFGRRVAELSGCRLYEGGDKASAELLREDGKRSVVCSVKAHGTGKNLQYAFSRNLVAEMPHDAAAWEQLLGRTHRIGQRADAVDCWLYLHTGDMREVFAKAQRLAEYVEATTPNRQKLCYAAYDFSRNLSAGSES